LLGRMIVLKMSETDLGMGIEMKVFIDPDPDITRNAEFLRKPPA
jgi:hypothetical protein